MPYFNGKASLEQVIATIQQNSRRYAKRQLTWFRNRMDLKWMDLVLHPENLTDLELAISDWLSK